MEKGEKIKFVLLKDGTFKKMKVLFGTACDGYPTADFYDENGKLVAYSFERGDKIERYFETQEDAVKFLAEEYFNLKNTVRKLRDRLRPYLEKEMSLELGYIE